MIKIGLVYFSQTGITKQLASAIISGIQSELSDDSVEIFEYSISGSDIINGVFHNEEVFEKLRLCDAIVFGSPTYMANVCAQFKAFADKSADYWSDQLWADKVAAGFTSGTGLNGEQSCTLLSLFTLACQHGTMWLGIDKHANGDEGLNRMGSQIGIAAHVSGEKLHSTDIKTAYYLGQRLVKIVQKIT